MTASVLPMVEYFGQGDQAVGFQSAMIVLSVFAIVCFGGCFLLTKERVVMPKPAGKKLLGGIWIDFKKMLQNDQWRIMAIISIFLLISVAMRGATTPFYVQYYLQEESLITLFMTSGMLAGVAGALSANWLVKKICKVKLMKLCAIGIIIANATLFFVPRDAMELALMCSILANFIHMIFTPLMFSAIPDTVDYGAKKLGQSAMAMAFSGHLLTIKLGIALGGAGTGWILAYTAYRPNVVQVDSALAGILFLYSASSVLAGIIVFACLKYYKLTRDFKETL